MPAWRSIRRKVDIDLQGVPVCRGGPGGGFFRSRAEEETGRARMPDPRSSLHGKGKGSARFWTCDLTEKYIEINASYRT